MRAFVASLPSWAIGAQAGMAASEPEMRITLCTISDLTGCLILNRLLPALRHHEVSVVLANRRRQVDIDVRTLAEAWATERTVPVDQIFPLLDRLSPLGGGDLLTFRQMSRRYGVGMSVVSTPEEWAGGDVLLETRPEFVVSSRFSFILSPEVIRRISRGAYNLHPGALPAYAGQYPVLRALAAGEEEIACVLHETAPEIDAGDVVGVVRVPVVPGRSHFWHRWKAYEAGAGLIETLVAATAADQTVPAVPQPAKGKPLPFPGEDELTAAARAGWPLFRMDEIAELMGRFIEGTDAKAGSSRAPALVSL